MPCVVYLSIFVFGILLGGGGCDRSLRGRAGQGRAGQARTARTHHGGPHFDELLDRALPLRVGGQRRIYCCARGPFPGRRPRLLCVRQQSRAACVEGQHHHQQRRRRRRRRRRRIIWTANKPGKRRKGGRPDTRAEQGRASERKTDGRTDGSAHSWRAPPPQRRPPRPSPPRP